MRYQTALRPDVFFDCIVEEELPKTCTNQTALRRRLPAPGLNLALKSTLYRMIS